MALPSGIRLGPYEIVSPLGAGGMGEVYKARDTRLARTVAIKVLPADSATDASARARFEREARSIAALSHPHICVVHDVGHQDPSTGSGPGIDYLVMELLEGETLLERLARAKGPLPLDEVLKIGVAIADALDKAHRAGIIHRDLKPANVMLTKSGPKLLDFGLAKLHGASPVSLSNETAATTAGPATAKGTILGTIHYMSPEQVEGRDADTRSDIWALGALLYEMATGQRPFDGESAASIIGAIMQGTPAPLSTRQPLTPPALEHLVERCLAKEPDERWQNAGDVKRELSWIAGESRLRATSERATSVASARKPLSRAMALLPWVLVAVVSAGAWLLWPHRQAAAEFPVYEFTLSPPPGTFLQTSLAAGQPVAIAPDGKAVVFVSAADGEPKLWVRRFDSLALRELPGTAGAGGAFWSPDSRSIGFFAGGKLKRIDVVGGTPVVVADVPNSRGGSWGVGGTMLFAQIGGPVQQVLVSGGAPTPVANLDAGNGENMLRWPQFLPDGRRFLFFVRSTKPGRMGIYLGSLDRPDEKTLIVESTNSGTYVPPRGGAPGRLLWVRDDTLIAQPFDPDRVQLSGEPVVVRGVDVGSSTTVNLSNFSVSEQGTLIYGGQNDRSQLAWFDRAGKMAGQAGAPDRYVAIRISPAGDRVALSMTDAKGSRDIWEMDLSGGVPNRLTRDNGYVGVWSPDGRQLAYHDGLSARLSTIDAAGNRRSIVENPKGNVYVNDWSPDGRSVLYTESDPATGLNLWVAPATGSGTSVSWLATPANESHGQFSPDGQWISHTSDESGRLEVYVRGASGTGSVRVSTRGGSFSRWRKDGRELFYRALDGKLMVVAVGSAADGLTFGAPVSLMSTMEPLGTFAYPYDVSADGQRILAMAPISTDAAARMLTVIVNWDAALPR